MITKNKKMDTNNAMKYCVMIEA